MERIVININGFSFNMLPVEGGQFVMGATTEQHGEAYENEAPAHSVVLDGFYLGETVVTQTLWNAVMGEGATMSLELPVTGKSWNDCQTFIRKLNDLTGRRFRLPTEAEWEFAARGGRMQKGCKYAGSNSLEDVAWYEKNSGRTIHPVKQKCPNELGLYDMSGNVWEWCSDRYGEYDIEEEGDGKAVMNPKGPVRGSMRVVRGASNAYYAQSCRVSCRLPLEPTGGNYGDTGFRLAMDENDSIGQTEAGSTTASEVKDPPQPNSFMGGATGGGRAKGKGTKGGNGHYWKPTGGGSPRKKKKWPWIVGVVVALLVVLVTVVSAGKDDTEIDQNNTGIAEPIPEKEPIKSVDKDENEIEQLHSKVNIMISDAKKIFESNKLEKYDSLFVPKVKRLSEGSRKLEKAADTLCRFYLDHEIKHDEGFISDSTQIIELANKYLEHYTSEYKREESNLQQMKENKKKNNGNAYDKEIEKSEQKLKTDFYPPQPEFY